MKNSTKNVETQKIKTISLAYSYWTYWNQHKILKNLWRSVTTPCPSVAEPVLFCFSACLLMLACFCFYAHCKQVLKMWTSLSVVRKAVVYILPKKPEGSGNINTNRKLGRYSLINLSLDTVFYFKHKCFFIFILV